MGTTQPEGAWMRAETARNRSHGSAANPRQCSIRRLDCDSCCRGFESHQPPQGIRLSRYQVDSVGILKAPRGNTRRPVQHRRRRCCMGTSRPAAFRISPNWIKFQLSTCGTTRTLAEPSLMRFAPFTGQQWFRTGNAAARVFAFQGRCFVVAFAPTVTTAGITGVPRRHHKAPSSFGRVIDETRRACIGSPTQRPAPTTYRTCRPELGKGIGYRSMRDGVTGSACSESNCPTVALGLGRHRCRPLDGEGDSHITLPQH